MPCSVCSAVAIEDPPVFKMLIVFWGAKSNIHQWSKKKWIAYDKKLKKVVHGLYVT